MAGSLNKVCLIGRLGRDPEIRMTQQGKQIANLNVATSERWKDRQSGEVREQTEWHRVVIYNEGLVNIVGEYLKKGSQIYLEGQLQSRKWTDQRGIERVVTEIVLKPFKGELTMLDGQGSQNNASRNNNNNLDDEVPF